MAGVLQWMLPRPTDIMSLRLDNTERQTVELADVILSSTRYMASWLRQRSWVLPQNRQALLPRTRPPRGSISWSPQLLAALAWRSILRSAVSCADYDLCSCVSTPRCSLCCGSHTPMWDL